MLWPEYLAFRAARDVITWRYLFSQALSHWLAYNFYSAEKTDAPGAEWFFGILAADPTIYLTVAMVFTTVPSSDMASSPLGRLRCKQKKDCACWPLWWIDTRDGTPPGPWTGNQVVHENAGLDNTYLRRCAFNMFLSLHRNTSYITKWCWPSLPRYVFNTK